MIYYKNRELSDRLDVNLAKWKRWVREFLPADPLGGLQSGYARQISLKDAFKVYFGGYLVSRVKYTIPEACLILSDLYPWLKRHGFFSVHLDQILNIGSTPHQILVYIYDKGTDGFGYVIREIVDSKTEENNTCISEKYNRSIVKLEEDFLLKGMITSTRVLSLTRLCSQFAARMTS